MVLGGALNGPKAARPADLEGLFGKPFPVHRPELLSTQSALDLVLPTRSPRFSASSIMLGSAADHPPDCSLPNNNPAKHGINFVGNIDSEGRLPRRAPSTRPSLCEVSGGDFDMYTLWRLETRVNATKSTNVEMAVRFPFCLTPPQSIALIATR